MSVLTASFSSFPLVANVLLQVRKKLVYLTNNSTNKRTNKVKIVLDTYFGSLKILGVNSAGEVIAVHSHVSEHDE